MILYLKAQTYFILLVAINLISAGLLQEVHAATPARSTASNKCVQRDDLIFNGVGLWTRLATVLKLYGAPLRIEPVDGANSARVYANYYYKDIKLLVFNSIVWQITVLTPDISTKSGIRLLSEFSAVAELLGVKLGNRTSGQSNRKKYKVPICPPDPPEVEEYVILSFDQNKRLVEFTVGGVFP